MTTFKWIVVAVLGAGVLAGGIVALVFWLTRGVVETAEGFLARVAEGKYEEAYNDAAPDFRRGQDLAGFRATMQRFGIDKYVSASWSNRRIRGSQGYLQGTVQTSDGKKVPTQIMLVRLESVWRVYSIQLFGGAQGHPN